MRLLLDEHISPALVGRLANADVFAQSVAHVGLAGRADREIWKYAFDHSFSVVTTNARDFIELLDVDVHPGLMVLRESGLSREEQWGRKVFRREGPPEQSSYFDLQRCLMIVKKQFC